MEVYLIRHTTPDVAAGICYGQSDLPLAVGYQSELAHTQSLLPESFDSIYSSPLLRCKTLAIELEGDAIFDPRLKELNFGEWELKAWKEIPEDQLNPWMEDFVQSSPPDGESYQQLYDRVMLFWEGLIKNEQEKIAIVSHAGVIRAFLSHLLGMDLKDSFKLQLDYGSVSKVTLSQGNPSIEYTNRI